MRMVLGSPVAQVDLATHFWRNPGGQRHAGAGCLDAIFKFANASNVGAVSQDAPRVTFELVPLFEKVVAAVIADAFDGLLVREADLRRYAARR